MSSPSSASPTTPTTPELPTTRSTRSLSVTSTTAPRHWHGGLGDRYEHHNVWVRGGIPQVYMPEKMNPSSSESASTGHRNSTSSASGNNERRRSSTSALFSGLSTQKRNPMDTARRDSWKDQQTQGGWFSKWWDGYTRG